MTTADQVTDLLLRVSQGDKQAEQDLIPRIYRELRKIQQIHRWSVSIRPDTISRDDPAG